LTAIIAGDNAGAMLKLPTVKSARGESAKNLAGKSGAEKDGAGKSAPRRSKPPTVDRPPKAAKPPTKVDPPSSEPVDAGWDPSARSESPQRPRMPETCSERGKINAAAVDKKRRVQSSICSKSYCRIRKSNRQARSARCASPFTPITRKS